MMLSMEWIQNMMMMIEPARSPREMRDAGKEAVPQPRFQDWSELLIDF
jgi:hypothetical protein